MNRMTNYNHWVRSCRNCPNRGKDQYKCYNGKPYFDCPKYVKGEEMMNLEELKNLWTELESFFKRGEKVGAWNKRDTLEWEKHLDKIAREIEKKEELSDEQVSVGIDRNDKNGKGLTQRELRFLDEFQYALRLNKRGDRIFEAIFDGVCFDCGNPTKKEFVSLIRKIYLSENKKSQK